GNKARAAHPDHRKRRSGPREAIRRRRRRARIHPSHRSACSVPAPRGARRAPGLRPYPCLTRKTCRSRSDAFEELTQEGGANGTARAALTPTVSNSMEKIMNRDQVKGTAKDVAGKIQRKTGEIAGSTSQQIKGAAKQVVGKVQKGVGDVRDDAERDADKRR